MKTFIQHTILIIFCFTVVQLKAQDRLVIKANYPDKKVVAQYVSNKIKPKADVKYHWMAKREIHSTRGDYSGNLLDGSYKEFFMSNQLKTKGKFENGLKVGEWKHWYDSGEIKSIYNWKNGKKEGDYYLFSEEGKLLKKGHFKNGFLNGKQYEIGEDTVFVSRFKKGELIVPEEKEIKEKSPFWNRIRKKDIHKIEETSEEQTEEKQSFFKKIFKKKEEDTKQNKEQKTKKQRSSKPSKEEKVKLSDRIKSWFKRSDSAKEKD